MTLSLIYSNAWLPLSIFPFNILHTSLGQIMSFQAREFDVLWSTLQLLFTNYYDRVSSKTDIRALAFMNAIRTTRHRLCFHTCRCQSKDSNVYQNELRTGICSDQVCLIILSLLIHYLFYNIITNPFHWRSSLERVLKRNKMNVAQHWELHLWNSWLGYFYFTSALLGFKIRNSWKCSHSFLRYEVF